MTLLPVQQDPVKMKVSGVHLQLRPNSPTGEVDSNDLRIVFDRAQEAVSHQAHLGGVGPHGHLLKGAKNIGTRQRKEVRMNPHDGDTCFSSGFRTISGGSTRYVEAEVSCWNWNWTSTSRPESL